MTGTAPSPVASAAAATSGVPKGSASGRRLTHGEVLVFGTAVAVVAFFDAALPPIR